jgi:hypothetical protein
MITTQSEQKINDLRANIDNLRNYNEKLVGEIQDAKRREIEVCLFLSFIYIFF